MELLLSSLPASFVASFIMGLSFGASACMFACVPTLGVALLGGGDGSLSTQRMAARFNGGRLFGYSLLGLVSGSLGATVTQLVADEHAALLFGALLMFAGVMLWRRGSVRGCGSHGTHSQGRSDSLFRGSMFGMGLGMSLTPCVPLAGVCAAAAATGSPWLGWLLGLAFGLGAVIPAQLFLGYGLGAAGQQLRTQLATHAARLSRIASGVLLLVGAGVMSGLLRL